MHFLSSEQSRKWCESAAPFGKDGLPLLPHSDTHHVRVALPTDCAALLPFCRGLVRSLEPYRLCLLWVTESEIWDSGANWHLYYRLRQSYGDGRLVREAPGHLFLARETADFTTFVEVSILCGFDAHLITDTTGYTRAFVSHDEFVEFSANSDNPDLVKAFAARVHESTA